MALAFVHRETVHDTTGGATDVTGSHTPTTDTLQLLVVAVTGTTTAPSSVTGAGLTWELVAAVVGNSRHLSLWRAQGSGSAGALTITGGGSPTGYGWSWVEVTGATIGNNGADAIVQLIGDTGGGNVTSLDLALAAAPISGNVTFGGFLKNLNEDLNPNTGETLLGRARQGSPTSAVASVSSLDQIVGMSSTNSQNMAGIVLEIEAAVDGGTPVEGSGETDVELVVDGSGHKRGGGSGDADVDLEAQGTGTKEASGSGTISLDLEASGDGTKRTDGAGETDVEIAAQGDGTKRAQGSGETDVGISVTGSGHKIAAGSGQTHVEIETSGEGAAEGTVSGSGETVIAIGASGEGTKIASGEGTSLVALDLGGAGMKSAHGSGNTFINMFTDGGGSKRAFGEGSVLVAIEVDGDGLSLVGVGTPVRGPTQVEPLAVSLSVTVEPASTTANAQARSSTVETDSSHTTVDLGG